MRVRGKSRGDWQVVDNDIRGRGRHLRSSRPLVTEKFLLHADYCTGQVKVSTEFDITIIDTIYMNGRISDDEDREEDDNDVSGPILDDNDDYHYYYCH